MYRLVNAIIPKIALFVLPTSKQPIKTIIMLSLTANSWQPPITDTQQPTKCKTTKSLSQRVVTKCFLLNLCNFV